MVRIVAADNACENASGHACKCLFHPLCSSCGVDYLILSSTAENYREDVRFCVWMCLKVWVCVCACVRVALTSETSSWVFGLGFQLLKRS